MIDPCTIAFDEISLDVGLVCGEDIGRIKATVSPDSNDVSIEEKVGELTSARTLALELQPLVCP